MYSGLCTQQFAVDFGRVPLERGRKIKHSHRVAFQNTVKKLFVRLWTITAQMMHYSIIRKLGDNLIDESFLHIRLSRGARNRES